MKYDNDHYLLLHLFLSKEEASDKAVIHKTEKNRDFNRTNVYISKNVIISQLAWGPCCTI